MLTYLKVEKYLVLTPNISLHSQLGDEVVQSWMYGSKTISYGNTRNHGKSTQPNWAILNSSRSQQEAATKSFTSMLENTSCLLIPCICFDVFLYFTLIFFACCKPIRLCLSNLVCLIHFLDLEVSIICVILEKNLF